MSWIRHPGHLAAAVVLLTAARSLAAASPPESKSETQLTTRPDVASFLCILDAMVQAANYWHANRAAVSRNLVMFLGGRYNGGGVAYFEGLRARFRSGAEATHTCLDLFFVPD